MSDPTAAIRLLLALFLGAAIGIERQWRHKAAGLKTNMLVALGAAGFAVLSNTFGPTNHNPAQLAAAVVGGIGFIGAGVIIHRGANVQGVTTAATLWANAAMAVATGLGHELLGAVIAGSVLLTQFGFRPAVRAINRARRGSLKRQFELRVDCDSRSLEAINDAVRSFAGDEIDVIRRSTLREYDRLVWRGSFRAPGDPPLDLTKLEERLASMEGVTRIEVYFVGYEADE